MINSRVGNIAKLSAYLKQNCGFFKMNMFLLLGQIFRDSLYMLKQTFGLLDLSTITRESTINGSTITRGDCTSLIKSKIFLPLSSLLQNKIFFLLVSLSCGESSSENVTYLSQSSVTSLTSPCTYTICPCSSNICRIRQASLSTFYLYDSGDPFEN